ARMLGMSVATNETVIENAAIAASQNGWMTNGIDDTKYTSAISGGNDSSSYFVMTRQTIAPRITPVAVPATPTIVPYQMNTRRTSQPSAPIDARMPISRRFSCTVMISVETMLNVDTNTIRPMTTKSTSCWILSIEKSWRFISRQSLTA